jgi:hypothetical protein
VEHVRYFGSVIRAQEGSLSELDGDTVAYHYQEPLGVVGQIISWNFPAFIEYQLTQYVPNTLQFLQSKNNSKSMDCNISAHMRFFPNLEGRYKHGI